MTTRRSEFPVSRPVSALYPADRECEYDARNGHRPTLLLIVGGAGRFGEADALADFVFAQVAFGVCCWQYMQTTRYM